MDGPSDQPLGRHVAAIAARHGVTLDVVAPEFDRMDDPPGHGVAVRLERILGIDPDFEALIIHRDCEGAEVATRMEEIGAAVKSLSLIWPVVPVIPIRMTEAWLLLDESAIRTVAGRPTGTEPLDLPPAERVESHADPKSLLQDTLAMASGLTGRRLRKFKRDFPAHRRQLLDRLDRSGPVCRLPAWQALERSTREAMARIHGAGM